MVAVWVKDSPKAFTGDATGARGMGVPAGAVSEEAGSTREIFFF